MEIFIIKLAIVVIPLLVLAVSVTIITWLSKYNAHHRLIWHRMHRNALRALGNGVMLR